MRSHTGKNGRKANFWAPAIGVLALGAFTYSLNLEGSVVRDSSSRDRTLNTAGGQAASGAVPAASGARYGRVVQGSYPIAPPVVVDYRDDEPSRLRREGKLIGPLQVGALNRGGACSFKAECDDGNPCTDDRCDIGPGAGEGDGICSHNPTTNGDPGDCDDGVYCNGAETCTGATIFKCEGVCVGGPTPGAVCETDAAHGDGCGGGVCNSRDCQGGPNNGAACTYHSQCTVVNGSCTNGGTPCPGEICQEENEGGASESPFEQQGSCRPTACATNADCNDNNFCTIDRCCIAGQLSALKICSNATVVGTAGGVEVKTCNVNADCGAGTCLTVEAASPCTVNGACDLSASPCGGDGNCTPKTCRTSGATFNGLACDTIADCGAQPARQCVAASVCFLGRCCDTPGVCTRETYNNCPTKWYAGDNGRLEPPANVACATGDFCPRYGSGIGNSGAYTVIAPRTSLSSQAEAITGLIINKLGDDYELDTGVGTYLSMTEMRYTGGVQNVTNSRAVFEFYDEFGNFNEDIFVITSINQIQIQTVIFNPPLTISAKGFVVAYVSQAFAAPDINSPGEFFWVGTDTVDHGTNNAAALWLNNGVAGSDILKACVGGLDAGTLCSANAQCLSNVCGNVNEVLSFEIEGTTVAAPIGACCNSTNGTCTQEVGWVCEGAGGVFLAEGQDCNVCSSNSPIAGENCTVNADCRLCTSGAEIGLPCTVAADCTGNGSSFCVGGSNNNGACTIQANCPGGLCVPVACSGTCVTACGTGACCITATGVCAVHPNAASCTGASGVWQGFGSNCDLNCCAQPTSSGADDCEDVQVHVISVPDPLVPPAQLTVTITGNNATASSDPGDPDSCYPPSVPGAELGWFEAFSINDCAYIRLDHCCTDPVKIPSYRILYDNCPCGQTVFTKADPNIPGEAPDGRGAPYCTTDNGWNNFGPLTAGTYYYPILSFLGGNFGQYQFHVTVKACPLAACCYTKCVGGSNNNGNCGTNADCPGGGTCTGTCELLNTLDCLDRNGSYLGPPNRATAVTICGSVCDTGSCCTGPGECKDDTDPGSGVTLMTKAACDTEPGRYIGGFRCFGGTCSGGTEAGKSCQLNADCPGGGATCVGDVATLAQPSPCPVCEIQGGDNCQIFDDSTNLRPSDLTAPGGGQRTADDFQPNGNTINTVCTWGAYFEPNEAGNDVVDCGTSAVDDFHVVVYNNSALDIPNFASIAGQSNVTTLFKAEVPNTARETLTQTIVYAYQLILDTPITGLNTANRYWLEISNDTSLPAENRCFWNWIGLDTAYNDYSANGSGAGYGQGAARPSDQAFCLDVDFLVPAAPTRACCQCNGTCSVKTKRDCDNEQGRWLLGSATCSGNPCGGGGPPANNNCTTVSAGSATADGDHLFTNRCSTTDGPNPVPTELSPGGDSMNADVWWKYLASCNGSLTVSTCASGATGAGADLDTFLAVYHDDNAPNSCPCPTVGTQIALLWPAGLGNDEGCVGFPFGAGGVVDGDVSENECYMIRVGGFAGQGSEFGDGILSILCSDTGSTTSPTAGNDTCQGGGNNGLPCSGSADCPGGACQTKNRFVSVTPSLVATAAADPSVIQVTAVTLPGALSAFNGDVWYADAPLVSNEGPPGGTFKSAKLACGTGSLRDWGAEGLVHLWGPIIVPGGTYHVRACAGVGVSCSEPPLIVNTAKYGDCVPLTGGASQPNFIDISAVVTKFQGVSPSAISKTRAQMQPKTLNLAVNVNFLDISDVVNAFKGFPYPYAGDPCP